MKKLIVILALVAPWICNAQVPDLAPGHYVIQLPAIQFEAGAKHSSDIMKIDVVVTNSTTGQLVLVPLTASRHPNWFHMVLLHSKAPTLDPKHFGEGSEKLPGLIALGNGKRLQLHGLWVQGEGVILLELRSNQSSGANRSGTATVEYDIRWPRKNRLLYQMDWSLSPKGSKTPAISKEVRYFGPKLKRKSVTVGSVDPEGKAVVVESADPENVMQK